MEHGSSPERRRKQASPMGPDAGTEAVRAALTFTGGKPDGFKFTADQFSFTFASVLTVHGTGIKIDSTAGPTDVVASFTSLGASLKAGPLQVGAEMRNFAFLGDGSFETRPGFGVFIEAKSLSGTSVGWRRGCRSASPRSVLSGLTSIMILQLCINSLCRDHRVIRSAFHFHRRSGWHQDRSRFVGARQVPDH